jgi:hypothetical protein
MDWKFGSSSTVPALQAQSLEFKPQSHTQKSAYIDLGEENNIGGVGKKQGRTCENRKGC